MFALAVKFMLALALSAGGAGTAALAAQGSQPNDLLYPVKLFSEDVGLALAADPQAQIDVLLEQAQVRTTEMAQLAAQGQSIPEAVPLRLQTHLETALQTAARLGDPQMQAALAKIRAQVQTQAQLMAQALDNAPAEVGTRLQTAERAMIQTRDLCDLGLSDPELLRERLIANRPETAPEQPEMIPGEGNGPGTPATPCGDCTPEGDQNQYGPGPQATPCGDCTPEGDQNQYQYGPGPQATPCGDCTPEGDQNQYGPGPQPDDTPEAGDSYGPGPQPTEPPGDGDDNSNGPASQPPAMPGDGGSGRP